MSYTFLVPGAAGDEEGNETGKVGIMRKARWGALAALVGTLAVVCLWTAPARSQRPAPLGTMPAELVKQSRVNQADVVRVLNVIGPVISQQLAAGRNASVPGLGVFRVVNIPEHSNLVGGRPTTIPSRNIVEFLPDGALDRAANSPNARPATSVPPFQYIPLPNQTPAQRVPPGRTPSTRTR